MARFLGSPPPFQNVAVFDHLRAYRAKLKNRQSPPATSATFEGDLTCNVANVAEVAGGDCHFLKTDMRYGFVANGYPKTWTGRIVAIDAWHDLTEWDRHGSNGRLYCGVCQEWVIECAHTAK